MNDTFDAAKALVATVIPAEFESLTPPPLLLPGESLEHYHLLRQAVFNDLAPQSAIEWLLVEVAEVSWEIQRYRIMRHKLLEAYRQQAIEAELRRVDLVGVRPEFERQADYYTVQNALSWRLDPLAAAEIEATLAAYGFDQHAISMEVYAQAREIFLLFEGLLSAAQAKRLLLLKEIKGPRGLLVLKANIEGHSNRGAWRR